MDYTHFYPNTIIQYHVSDMMLHIDYSNKIYLVMPNVKSCGTGFFYRSNHPTSPGIALVKKNDAILTQCATIQRVMSSAAEAETAQVFNNTRVAIPIRRTLEEMNHSRKGPTYLKTDNQLSEGFAKSTI